MKAKLIGYDPSTEEFIACNWSPVLNTFLKPEKRFHGLGVIPAICEDACLNAMKAVKDEPNPVKAMKAIARTFLVNWMLVQKD